jgi:hypothetical protein
MEGIARNGHQNGFLRVQDTAWRIDAQTLHVRGLNGPSNTATARINDLKKQR